MDDMMTLGRPVLWEAMFRFMDGKVSAPLVAHTHTHTHTHTAEEVWPMDGEWRRAYGEHNCWRGQMVI